MPTHLMRATALLAAALCLAAGGRAADPEKTEKRRQAVLGLPDTELLPDGKGMLVKAVRPDGPAARMTSPANPAMRVTLEPGDVIVAVGGKSFRTRREFFDRMNEANAAGKGKVRLTVKDRTTGRTDDYVATPDVVEYEVPAADPAAEPAADGTQLPKPKITRLEDPMLPDLIPDEKKP